MQDKWAAHKAATELLERVDERVLRYVALELRLCIESVVYEKLHSYRDWIPIDAGKWQPPQAFKALLNVEADLDDTKAMSMALPADREVRNAGPYTRSGSHHRPSVRWLRKTWKKLGRCLYAGRTSSGSGRHLPSREFLQDVVAELALFVELRSVTLSFSGALVEFACLACGEVNKASERVLEVHQEAYCAKCQAHYSVEKDESGYGFHLFDLLRKCPDCQADLVLPLRTALAPGSTVTCRKCTAKFIVYVSDMRCKIALQRIDPRSGR
jgi:hypothetical protein